MIFESKSGLMESMHICSGAVVLPWSWCLCILVPMCLLSPPAQVGQLQIDAAAAVQKVMKTAC